MTVQGTSHQGQSNEKILNECVSRACQTRALDLPPIDPDAFNPIIIRFLEKLTEEQWRQLSIGRMDPVMRALLAEMCLEIVRFVSEAILEVIIPAIFRFVRIYSHVSPVSGKSLTESERSSSTNLKVRKRGSSKSSRSCTAKSSSSRNGVQRRSTRRTTALQHLPRTRPLPVVKQKLSMIKNPAEQRVYAPPRRNQGSVRSFPGCFQL
ncbi:uncharacterized protein LOC135571357 isoform X1 [Oncorhynchus nerka]